MRGFVGNMDNFLVFMKRNGFIVFVVFMVIAIIGTIVFGVYLDAKNNQPEILYKGEIDSIEFSDGRAILQLPDDTMLVIPLLGDIVYNIDFQPQKEYEVWVYPRNKRLVRIVPLVRGVED